jgi:hypothetical protein
MVAKNGWNSGEAITCWRRSARYARREQGSYGGRFVSFLSLPDLIRSKETERESDRQDVGLLEEIHDARNLGQIDDEDATVAALACLRSRRGFRRAADESRFSQPTIVVRAFERSTSPISRGWLAPALGGASVEIIDRGMIGEILAGPLKQTQFGDHRHMALVEAIRRLYKREAIAADRADMLTNLR